MWANVYRKESPRYSVEFWRYHSGIRVMSLLFLLLSVSLTYPCVISTKILLIGDTLSWHWFGVSTDVTALLSPLNIRLIGDTHSWHQCGDFSGIMSVSYWYIASPCIRMIQVPFPQAKVYQNYAQSDFISPHSDCVFQQISTGIRELERSRVVVTC